MPTPNDELRGLDAEIGALTSKLQKTHLYSSREERERDIAHRLELVAKQMGLNATAKAAADAVAQEKAARDQRIFELSTQLRSAKPEEAAAARKALDEMALAERNTTP